MRTLLVAAFAVAIVPAPAAASSPAMSAPVVVHIKNETFIPASVTIRPGASVTFVNDDDDAHTATADNQSWDSEGLNLGQRWSHKFAKAGTVKYHCTVHPMMHGTIIVKGAK